MAPPPLYNPPTASAPGTSVTGFIAVDFGAAPGSTQASVAVGGQAAIIGSSIVQAWISPIATVDHSQDEHIVESFAIRIGNLNAGSGFTIYAVSVRQLYGLWSVAWRWE